MPHRVITKVNWCYTDINKMSVGVQIAYQTNGQTHQRSFVAQIRRVYVPR